MTGAYHLVLVLGQSNANGSNTDFEPDGQDARDPRIDAFPGSGDRAGRIVPAREPLAPIGAHPPGGLGPGGPFASLLLTTLPTEDRVLIVPVTMGGTGMRRHGTFPGVWKVGFEKEGAPNLFDAALEHARAALAAAGPDARIEAVIWHQGESDGGRAEDDYAADLDELILALRQRLPEATHAPFIVGQMAAERRMAYPDHEGVAEALRHTPDRIPNTGYAEAPPVGHINDASTHFTAEGQRILGANYFAAYQAIAQSRRTDSAARD